jgi:hypothetical protein
MLKYHPASILRLRLDMIILLLKMLNITFLFLHLLHLQLDFLLKSLAHLDDHENQYKQTQDSNYDV